MWTGLICLRIAISGVPTSDIFICMCSFMFNLLKCIECRLILQLLVFWTLSIVQSLFKSNVSETESSLRNVAFKWIMSKRLIIALICHRHKLLDPIDFINAKHPLIYWEWNVVMGTIYEYNRKHHSCLVWSHWTLSWIKWIYSPRLQETQSHYINKCIFWTRPTNIVVLLTWLGAQHIEKCYIWTE
jgi:hypothetical protein